MATQRVPALQFPSQPSPKKVERVTQDRLAEIITLRQQIEKLEARLGEAQTEVKSALESGAEVEPGLFRATLKVTERTSVSWKSVVERELGEDYARRVLSSTKPDKYTHLVVTAYALGVISDSSSGSRRLSANTTATTPRAVLPRTLTI
jgi:hypothetical protein